MIFIRQYTERYFGKYGGAGMCDSAVNVREQQLETFDTGQCFDLQRSSKSRLNEMCCKTARRIHVA